jgi:uncharacterized protein YggE
MKIRARLAATAVVALLLAAPIAATISGAFAQDTATESPGTIEVYADGTVLVEPDAASIVIGVDINQPNLADAQAEADTKMTEVIAAIVAAGIPAESIQTTWYNVSVINEYDEYGRMKGVIGYQVSHQVTVVTEDLDGLGALIDSVVDKGANSIYGITFFAKDSTAATSQARTLAVENAAAKAQELAAAAGVELGPLVKVSETYSPSAPAVRSEGMAADGMGGGAPIQTGSLQVQVGVQLVYEIAR